MAAVVARRGLRLGAFGRRTAAPPAEFGAYDVLSRATLPVGPPQPVPAHIPRPSYAATGTPPPEPTTIPINTETTIERLRKAGDLARRALDHAATVLRPGLSAAALDAAVHGFIVGHGAYPSPLNYRGFPKSICTSVNNVVCHGIPDSRPLLSGDIVNVDVTVFLDGVHGDTSRTFLVGEVDAPGRALVQATEEALRAGIAVCGPGVPLNRIGDAISDLAEQRGYSVSPLFCGHGINSQFHTPPIIIHCRNDNNRLMQPGMVFTIEPILNQGTDRAVMWPDKWTYVTGDGGRSAQFEHMVLITRDGHAVLT